MTFDVLISGGTVVDGTGQPGFPSDVWVKDKKIAHLGNLSGASAARVIDATGLTVSPGFIDAHAHSDGALLIDGQHANGIRQGITTEIICPDGLGYPPLSREDYRMYRQYLSGILGLPPEDLDMSSMAASKENYHQKTSCNVAAFIGHGPVRLNVVGMQDVPLRDKALETAKGLVRESMEQGAVGFATGLSYFPHTYSDTDELVELCKVVAEFDLPLSIHLRNHNTDRGFAGGGVEEAMEIGRRSGVMVHLEHYRTQADSAGKIDELLEPVERAKADGVDVTLECYPYPVGSSFPCSFFPGPFHEGGPEAIAERLSDDSQKAEYVRILEDTPVRALAGNAWTWIGSEKNKHLEGMAWQDAAELRGEAIGEMVCNVMLEENMVCGFRGVPPQSVRLWRLVEEDIMKLISRPDYMIGSDAIPVGGMVHPRAYGCFPRIFGRLRRRHGYPLEQIIQRMTQNPAQRFGLEKRGEIREGYFADLVVFDAENVIDRATFEDPAQPPEGIPFVLVNGEVAVDHDRCTGVLAGEAVP